MDLLRKRIADAHANRKYSPTGDTAPTITEIEVLMLDAERLNAHGSNDEFIDAQSALIDALLVMLHPDPLS